MGMIVRDMICFELTKMCGFLGWPSWDITLAMMKIIKTKGLKIL